MTDERMPGPMGLRWRSWRGALWRTIGAIWSDKLTDWAAALTYYSVLSLFPGMLVVTAVLGLVGSNATGSLIGVIDQLGPDSGTRLLADALGNLQGARALSGPLAVAGLAVSVWTASAYLGAFIRAANSIYEIDEGRSMWKTLLLRLGLTVVMLIVVGLGTVGVVASEPVTRAVGEWLGIGSAGVRVWNMIEWPVLAVLVSLMCALLYWAAPNVVQPGFRWITPGSLLAVLVWSAASAGFAVYVANFSSFNKVYGSLAAAVIFLVWLWITNLAVLVGAAFDAELVRGRGIEQGRPPDAAPFLPAREEPGSGDAAA